jgi:hypothetical protein
MNKYSTLTIFLNSSSGDEVATTIHLVKSYNKLFHNAQHLLLNLNSKERCFYDYLCEKMDGKNRVYTDLSFKEKFLQHYSKIKKKGNAEIKVAHITSYLNKLTELGLLLQNASKSYYTINPKYVFNGTVAKRLDLIKALISERHKKNQPINHLIDKHIL